MDDTTGTNSTKATGDTRSPYASNEYVENDLNLIVYDEMNEEDVQHPAHQRTISADYRALVRNKRMKSGRTTSPKDRDGSSTIDDHMDEIKEEEDVETSYEMLGVDGLDDDDGIGVIRKGKNGDMSYDHLNEDEIDIVDMSDSPYA